MLASTNEQAARLSALANEALKDVGEVSHGPTTRLRNHAASVGDRIVTRRNDRTLRTSAGGWVVNGDTWTVERVRRDGSIMAKRERDADRIVLPVEYVRQHVELAYAMTVHRAQGSTIDHCHAAITDRDTHATLYVSSTRGRRSNHLWVMSTDIQTEPERTLVRIVARPRAESAAAALAASHREPLAVPSRSVRR